MAKSGSPGAKKSQLAIDEPGLCCLPRALLPSAPLPARLAELRDYAIGRCLPPMQLVPAAQVRNPPAIYVVLVLSEVNPAI